jgi:hypothetical protein
LLGYSLILKYFQKFFFLINLHTIPHNEDSYSDPLVSTLLKHLWQQLQPQVFLGMTLQAWHTCFFRSSMQILSSSVRLDGERRCTASGQGSGWDTEGHSETCPEATPALCWLWVVVLLDGEPLPQSEVLSILEQVFIKDLSVLCAVHLSLVPA